MRYHLQLYSSALAKCGAFGTSLRSMTRGFRSIISLWSCSASIAVALEIVDGSGVMVVKTLFLDIATAFLVI